MEDWDRARSKVAPLRFVDRQRLERTGQVMSFHWLYSGNEGGAGRSMTRGALEWIAITSEVLLSLTLGPVCDYLDNY